MTELYGRVVRGVHEDDFNYLANPERKIIFFMGSEGLQGLLRLSGHDLLHTIGYPADYIQHLVESRTRFKLVVFSAGAELRRATWENVLELIGHVYATGVAAKIRPYLPSFKSGENSFAAIQSGGTPFKEVDKTGADHPEYLTVERFAALARPTLRQVRAFLYYNLRLNELFTGNGYTKTESGQPGTPEFVGLNRRIQDLPNARILDLPLAGAEAPAAKSPYPVDNCL